MNNEDRKNTEPFLSDELLEKIIKEPSEHFQEWEALNSVISRTRIKEINDINNIDSREYKLPEYLLDLNKSMEELYANLPGDIKGAIDHFFVMTRLFQLSRERELSLIEKMCLISEARKFADFASTIDFFRSPIPGNEKALLAIKNISYDPDVGITNAKL